ncbi:DUF3726 domain-containing protein [Aquisalimonas asiatica]|uniref:DUF3726 domain-containing protein n=1 Tax=Aquisalimonas asiatica TaxID=406100 RepID=A0A1H8SJW7_9GAMM|nr:DUF3726 domain-containing protein [Aquisalimonas asiatica]SEO78664.1 Protein of unknown function [Aquisalimonas asiatica]
MMRISHNELLSMARKAFEGLGFDAGDREDAAHMVLWLERHGLDGLQELRKAIDFLPGDRERPLQTLYRGGGLYVMDAGGASVLCHGAVAVDAGIAMAQRHPLATVRLEGCHNRLFILADLARSCRHGVSALAVWRNEHGHHPRDYVVAQRAGDPLPTVRVYRDDTLAEPPVDQGMTLVFSRDFDLLPQLHPDVDADRVHYSALPDDLVESSRQRLASSITVDEALWERLRGLAMRILVEASDQSRRGAGE